MKSTIYTLVAFILLATSCRTVSVPETRTPSGPYVQLKNGRKYQGSSAERSSGIFVKDKIVLGDTSFHSKDVAFYSTGGTTFANVGKKTFATQVATGKINLYRYTSTSSHTEYNTMHTSPSNTWQQSSHSHTSYYIQPKEGAPVENLTYHSLAPMVKERTPEYQVFERYKKTRVVSRSLGFGALGLLAGGIAVMATSGSSDVRLGAGLVMMGVSIPVAFSWFGLTAANSHRLLKTVVVADKDANVKPTHTRVK